MGGTFSVIPEDLDGIGTSISILGDNVPTATTATPDSGAASVDSALSDVLTEASSEWQRRGESLAGLGASAAAAAVAYEEQDAEIADETATEGN